MLFLWHVLCIVEIRVVWHRGSCVRVIQLCKERHKIEVQNGCIFFIKIYKQVIFQHECIVSSIQSASGNALHCAWHFHRRNSSVLAYKADLNVLILDSLTLSYFYLFDIHFIPREFFFNTNVLPYVSCWSNFNFFIIKLIDCILNVKHIFSYIYVMNMYVWIWILTFSCLFETADIIIRPYK